MTGANCPCLFVVAHDIISSINMEQFIPFLLIVTACILPLILTSKKDKDIRILNGLYL